MCVWGVCARCVWGVHVHVCVCVWERERERRKICDNQSYHSPPNAWERSRVRVTPHHPPCDEGDLTKAPVGQEQQAAKAQPSLNPARLIRCCNGLWRCLSHIITCKQGDVHLFQLQHCKSSPAWNLARLIRRCSGLWLCLSHVTCKQGDVHLFQLQHCKSSPAWNLARLIRCCNHLWLCLNHIITCKQGDIQLFQLQHCLPNSPFKPKAQLCKTVEQKDINTTVVVFSLAGYTYNQWKYKFFRCVFCFVFLDRRTDIYNTT